MQLAAKNSRKIRFENVEVRFNETGRLTVSLPFFEHVIHIKKAKNQVKFAEKLNELLLKYKEEDDEMDTGLYTG